MLYKTLDKRRNSFDPVQAAPKADQRRKGDAHRGFKFRLYAITRLADAGGAASKARTGSANAKSKRTHLRQMLFYLSHDIGRPPGKVGRKVLTHDIGQPLARFPRGPGNVRRDRKMGGL